MNCLDIAQPRTDTLSMANADSARTTEKRTTFELAEPIVCTKCGFSSRDAADFVELGGTRCVKFFACSRRQDEADVAKKYGKAQS